MELRILRGTVANGELLAPGDLVTVSAGDARLLINLGKAEEAPKPKPKARKKASDASAD